MPLARRLPKRGFNNKKFATLYIPVNLESLNQFDDGATVDEAALRAAGLVNGRGDGVKILGQGELEKKLTVKAAAFSASARAAIEGRAAAAKWPPRRKPRLPSKPTFDCPLKNKWLRTTQSHE